MTRDIDMSGFMDRATSVRSQELSDWQCRMFGATGGFVYRPIKGHEPHRLARFLMRILFDCHWEKAT